MPEESKVEAAVRVMLTLEVRIGASWDGNCSIAQVYKQGAEEAVNRVRKEIGGIPTIKIVGEPMVTAILSEKP